MDDDRSKLTAEFLRESAERDHPLAVALREARDLNLVLAVAVLALTAVVLVLALILFQ